MKKLELRRFCCLAFQQKIIAGLVVLGVILWIILGCFYRQNIITTKNVGFTKDEITTIQTQITENIAKLNSAPTKIDKFKLSLIIGDEYRQIGSLAKAKKYYSRATKIFPNNVAGWDNLVSLGIAMRDFTSVYSALKHYIKLAPTDSAALIKFIDAVKDSQSDIAVLKIKNLYNRTLPHLTDKLALTISYADFLSVRNFKSDAIRVWNQAKTLDYANASIYQARIDALNNVNVPH